MRLTDCTHCGMHPTIACSKTGCRGPPTFCHPGLPPLHHCTQLRVHIVQALLPLRFFCLSLFLLHFQRRPFLISHFLPLFLQSPRSLGSLLLYLCSLPFLVLCVLLFPIGS